MTETAMSPLRRRMIEDMTIRRFAPATQHNYVRFVKFRQPARHVRCAAHWLLRMGRPSRFEKCGLDQNLLAAGVYEGWQTPPLVLCSSEQGAIVFRPSAATCGQPLCEWADPSEDIGGAFRIRYG
jgi:hypothetical protein